MSSAVQVTVLNVDYVIAHVDIHVYCAHVTCHCTNLINHLYRAILIHIDHTDNYLKEYQEKSSLALETSQS